MTLLAQWDKITVRIWSYHHNPPHIHVMQAEHVARIVIGTGAYIDGHLPTKSYRRIQKWLKDCQEEIVARWELVYRGEGFSRIGENCQEEGAES